MPNFQGKVRKINLCDRSLPFQRSEIGQILMAIDNIAEKCRRRLDPPVEDMTRQEKLEIVKV